MKRVTALLLLICATGCGESLPAQRARLLDADGNVQLELEIAIAETEYERQEGLRLHGPLAEDEALLLVFPKEAQVCITNTGVPFPIHVLYISATHQVTAIRTPRSPQRPRPLLPPRPAGAGTERGHSRPLQLRKIGALLTKDRTTTFGLREARVTGYA